MMKLEMGARTDEDDKGVPLKVRRSPISGSGIARVHTNVLKKGDFVEGKPHFVQHGDKKRIMRLVADDMMDRGRISIRQKDMEKLNVKEGDEVVLLPVLKVGNRLTQGLGIFRKKEE